MRCRRLLAAIQKETNPTIRKALVEAHAAVILFKPDASEADKIEAVGVMRQRGDQDALALLPSLPDGTPEGVKRTAQDADRRDPGQPRDVGQRPERLVRALARLGAAARRDRARHHLRRHGRHQHGARRDGDARRLHDLRRAGSDPRPQSRAVRLLAADRDPARLPGCRLRRHPDRARRHPLSLRPAARNAARDLGHFADPAAGGAHRPSAPPTRTSATRPG